LYQLDFSPGMPGTISARAVLEFFFSPVFNVTSVSFLNFIGATAPRTLEILRWHSEDGYKTKKRGCILIFFRDLPLLLLGPETPTKREEVQY
jgi:hypothetical protein